MAAFINRVNDRKRAVFQMQIRKRAAAVAVTMVCLEEKRRKRRAWKKKWLNEHDSLGAFPALLSELRSSDMSSYINFLRIEPDQFMELAQKIEPIIKKEDTNFRQAISTEERLAVTLRFLATGETYKSLSYLFRLGSTTIGVIVPETCKAIYTVLKDEYLKVPQSPEEWKAISSKFMEKWNFPHTLGAIDGKHIALKAPPKSGSVYFNYKHFHSIVLMALVDADYKFIYVDVGCNGRISDGGVFAKCSLSEAMNKRLLNIPAPCELPGDHGLLSYHIIGDEAFPLRDYLLKPFPHRNLDKEHRIYNYRISRARRVVENAFGIMSARFRVLLSRMSLAPEKAEDIVLCTCVLHNFLCVRSNNYMSSVDTEDSSTHLIKEGVWRSTDNLILQSCGLPHSNNTGIGPKEKRLKTMKFVNSEEGAVEWQEDMI